jgi:hypothetical protein
MYFDLLKAKQSINIDLLVFLTLNKLKETTKIYKNPIHRRVHGTDSSRLQSAYRFVQFKFMMIIRYHYSKHINNKLAKCNFVRLDVLYLPCARSLLQ